MDANKVKSINNITGNLHDEVDKIYENLMDEDTADTGKAIDSMVESLKHLKTNLKTDDI
tara:strand:+ start:1606 stop:1782 length:177 start_codon:yes stop_codon:yes gene_type:complete